LISRRLGESALGRTALVAPSPSGVNGKEITRIISARAAEKHDIRRDQKQGNGLRRNADHCTEEQLTNMVRLRDVRPKVAVSLRLDPCVLEWLKSKGKGHLTRATIS